MPPTLIRPQVIILKEGTDTSQGKPALLSNISACLAVVDILRTTLGPRGMDKLIVDGQGKSTISNDGATILKLLDVVHPAAKALVDIARAQDAEVGDGTTSVVVLAGELLRQVKPLIEEGVAPQVIIRAFRRACQLAIERVQEVAVKAAASQQTSNLQKCAMTAMNSKLIAGHKHRFAEMAVDAVMRTRGSIDDVDNQMIGIKKVVSGSIEDSCLVDGIAFKKTFSYAGFEQQPKAIDGPRIACLNIELELKAERDNAEVRLGKVADYQAIVDAEWTLLYERLEATRAAGANVVLSRLPIGDVATQWFADRDIFSAGRVSADDLELVARATGAAVLSSVGSAIPLGTCARFEERQVGSERYNFFTGCPNEARACTIILRGGSEQFIAEVHRSLHDAIMIVRRTLKSDAGIVAGGGAVEMDLARHLREASRTTPGKAQLVIGAFARAFEAIPRQIAENAGIDGIDILAALRKAHADPKKLWFGIDIDSEQGIVDNMQAGLWEPALVKTNAIAAACEAACMIVSVDLTVELNKQQPSGASGDFSQMAARAGLPR